MVKLSNTNGENTHVDTTECQFVMYRAINWIPPRFLVGYNDCVTIPNIVYKNNEVYHLKDGYCTTRHYEVVNGNAE